MYVLYKVVITLKKQKTWNIPFSISSGHLKSGKDKIANVGTRYEKVLPWTIGSLKEWREYVIHTWL